MKKLITIIIVVIILIVVGALTGVLKEKPQAANNNTDKKEAKIKIEDQVKNYGNMNIYLDLGTGMSNDSLKKDISYYMVTELEKIQKRKDYNEISNLTFVFNGDTNQGNTKIAQFDFKKEELKNLKLDKNTIQDRASNKWLSPAFDK